MTPIVIDASVAVKWFLRDSNEERHSTEAVQYLHSSGSGEVHFIQPPHFFAEVAAVLARLKPQAADADIADLMSLQFTVLDNDDLYRTAGRLSVQLEHHLFDTMYHAAALAVSDASLITADRRYYRKASHLGAIRLLGA